MLGIIIGLPSDLKLQDFLTDIKLRLLNTTTGDSLSAAASYRATILFQMYIDDGILQELSRGQTYMLYPSTDSSSNLRPLVNGNEHGIPMRIHLESDSGHPIEIDFRLTTFLVGDAGGRIHCSFDSSGISCEQTGEQWNPRQKRLLIPGRSRLLTVLAGIVVEVADTTTDETYVGRIIPIVRDGETGAGINFGSGPGDSWQPLFTLTLDHTTGTDENYSQILPRNFELLQNYPNPFNPSTVIGYSLPKSTFVSVRVYDLLGREVGTIVSEKQEAGQHGALFNGDGLSSGVYFYRIQTVGFVQTKKMLFLR